MSFWGFSFVFVPSSLPRPVARVWVPEDGPWLPVPGSPDPARNPRLGGCRTGPHLHLQARVVEMLDTGHRSLVTFGNVEGKIWNAS